MPEDITPGQAGQGEGTPGEGAGQGSFNYEHAYSQLRPEYTRATQEAAQYRDQLSEYEGLFEALHSSDPEVQAMALDALGLEPAEAGSPGAKQDDDEWVDPLEEEVSTLRSTVEELRSAREQEQAQREAQEVEALRDDYIGEAIGFIEEALSDGQQKAFKFTEREESVLGNLAIAMTGEDGLPDVRAAYQVLYGDEGFLEVNRSRWIDTKTGANPAPLGTSIPAEQKPRTKRDRVAWADERWAQIERQQ